jgi:cell division septation protein DedD
MSPLGTLPAEEITDTEITLGTGKMLALFFGLVVLCAIFFGMGFTMGKNSIRSAPELLPSPSTTARTVAANRNVSTPPASTDAQPAQPQPAASANSTDNSSSGTPTQSASASPQDQAAPAIPQPGQAYYVQVAAVSKQEDAEALVESLKGRQYSAFIASPGSDKLYHVQVGPFADVKSAEDMRTKLVSDGYSPILKK